MTDKELFEKITLEDRQRVYSYSKLSSFYDCLLAYKHAYIDKIRDKGNIYSNIGTAMHDCLERIYNGELSKDKFSEEFLTKYSEIIEEFSFPNEVIKENLTTCLNSYIDNFYLEKEKTENERYFLVQIGDIWLHGYIDKIIFNEDGTIDIVDYKISSKFTKGNIEMKANQLVLYAYALEQKGYKINKIKWDMLKYCNVYFNVDKRKRNPLVERNKIWDKYKTQFLKACELSGAYSEIEAYELWTEMNLNNTLDIPEPLKPYIKIEKGYVEYPYNENSKQKLIDFVNETVKKILEQKDFEPYEVTTSNSFFCSFLCGYKNNCPSYKKFIDNLPDEKVMELLGIDRNSTDENTSQVSFQDFFA